MAADYLFQQDKHYDVSYDTGDKVIQCGRHNDIYKFWLMWRAKVIFCFLINVQRRSGYMMTQSLPIRLPSRSSYRFFQSGLTLSAYNLL